MFKVKEGLQFNNFGQNITPGSNGFWLGNSVWVNHTTGNFNGYNENIRLVAAGNGASVIAFSGSGETGEPATSILGYSDRLEFRDGSAWIVRNYNNYSQASGSFRAPIFYDSNDTNYYVDPNSTSYIAYLGRRAHHTGHLVGSYNSVGANSAKTNPIYTIGSNYNPADSTLGDMYGIGYSHSNASFISGNGFSGWGMYVASDGDARVYLSGENGTVAGTGGAYLPIYYDYNDTAYYIDPNAAGDINYGGKIRSGILFGPNHSWGDFLLVGGNGRTDYTNSTTVASVCTTDGNLHIDAASGHHMYLNYYDGDRVYFGSGNNSVVGEVHADGSARFPIYYDYNDTGYFADFNSGANTCAKFKGGIHVSAGNTTGNGIILADDGDIVDLNDAYCTMRFSYGVRVNSANRGGSWVHQLHSNGNLESTVSHIAPIFYDRNDTSYYCDPNSTSRFNTLNIVGSINSPEVNGYDYWEGSITITGDANTYYPVTWWGGNQDVVTEIEIFRGYSETAPSTWNTATHRGGLTLKLTTNFGGWGGSNYQENVYDCRETYSTIVSDIARFGSQRGFCVWLRGGTAVYHIRIKGRNYGPTVSYTTYDPGANSTGVSPRTDAPKTNLNLALFKRGSALYSNNNLVLDHGGDHQTKSGTLQSDNSLRSPIYYDSNNTGYYVDGAGTSNLLYITMPHRGNGTPNLYLNNGSQENWRVIDIRGGNNNHGIGVSSTSRSWFGRNALAFHVSTSDSIRFHSDGWDTMFEVAGGSGDGIFKGNLTIGRGQSSSYLTMHDSDETSRVMHCNSTRIGFLNTSSAWGSYCDNGGNWFSDFSVRAPIFYDSNNTGYYGDFASTSRFNYVKPNQISCQNNGDQGTPRWDFRAYVVESPHHYSNSSSGAMYLGESNHVYIRSIGDASGDFRAPIFYDTNNTAYYTDPNGTSRMNDVYPNRIYFNANYGHGVYGVYSSTRYQHVWSMGTAYKLPDDGTTTGNMYGLAWSHPNAGGTAANLASHGLLLLENGTFKGAWGGGSFRTPADVRGTIFYDYDNTGYYCNPASDSNFNTLTCQGNAIYIRGGSPTLYFRDTDHRSCMLHNNSNLFYILRGSGNDSTSWASVGAGWPLTVNLETNDATFGGNVTAYSDARLKTNVKPLGITLEQFKSVKAKRFDWIETGKHDVGFIAQDVEAAGLVEVVKDFEERNPETGDLIDTYKTLDYSRMVAMLWDVVSQQQDQIEELKAQVQSLKEK